MKRRALFGSSAPLTVLALLALVSFVAADSVATCRTPMYDGVCCDSTSSPVLWPSGTGCCIGGQPYPGSTCPLLLKNDAQFITQTPPPATLTAGQTVPVSVTMKNIGTTTWTDDSAGKYRLGLTRQNIPVPSTDPTYAVWGASAGRQSIQAGESIQPLAEKTFSFQITAPLAPGTYEFQWQMVQEDVEWFGQNTPSMLVTVVTPTPTPTPTPSPTATPTPTPTLSPTVTSTAIPEPTASTTPLPTVIASPTLPPNVRPQASIKLSCPTNLVTTRNVTLATLTLSFGQASCSPEVQLNVVPPNKAASPSVTPLGCVSGRSAFNVTTTKDGTYTVSADYSGSVDSCVFAVAGTPPTPTPELSPATILLAALLAAAWARKTTSKHSN